LSLTNVDTSRINTYTWIGATLGLDQDLFFISMAARMLGMHPQTLRKYERLGLVQPSRTIGSMRLYSRDELARLRVIKHLVGKGGVNLAGVQRLLSIAEVVERIRPLARDEALSARDGRRRLVQELDEIARMLGLD
jgi:MerR family transcriptional regulator/heat shock protein HspR